MLENKWFITTLNFLFGVVVSLSIYQMLSKVKTLPVIDYTFDCANVVAVVLTLYMLKHITLLFTKHSAAKDQPLLTFKEYFSLKKGQEEYNNLFNKGQRFVSLFTYCLFFALSSGMFIYAPTITVLYLLAEGIHRKVANHIDDTRIELYEKTLAENKNKTIVYDTLHIIN